MKRTLVLAALLLPAAVLAETITTRDGASYRDAQVVRVDSDGVTIKHRTGVAKVSFAKLPSEMRQKYEQSARIPSRTQNEERLSVASPERTARVSSQNPQAPPHPGVQSKRTSDQQASTETSVPPRTHWWILLVKAFSENGPFPKGYMYGVTLVVASTNTHFISSFDQDSWQGRHRNGELIIMVGSSSDSMVDLGSGIKARTISFVGVDATADGFLQKAFIRAKGDTSWVRLSDILTVDVPNKTYRVSHCSRCAAVLKRGATECANCGAVFAMPNSK